MIEWLLMPENQVSACRSLLGGAWSGTAALYVLQPTPKSRTVTIVVPEIVTARRAARFPDVLTDWADIYEEPLFPSPRTLVAGELLSESGDDCLALFADLGAPAGARGGIAWFEKGALVEFEQVGGAAVSWQRGQPLSRPVLAGARAQLASLGRAHADTERDAGLYERVEAGLAATTEAVLGRALIRLLGDDPPPLNELAQLLVRGRPLRLSV